MEKATIKVLNSSFAEASSFTVLFNPADYTVTKSNVFTWKTIPGMSLPMGQFVSGEARVMAVDLFFDTWSMTEDEITALIPSPTYETKDVRNFTDQVTNLLDVNSEIHAPPVIIFAWGTFQFTGVVEKVEQKFTMFTSAGIPARATVKATIKEYSTVTQQSQGTPRHSSDRTKQRVLIEGDQLWTMADREYGDCSQWREIARANKITNPRGIKPGMHITIPPLE